MSSRWDTSRTEAFSDGVFAIAVTLLVLDLAIPQEEVQKHLAHGILHEWPGYLGYVTSFVVIGGLCSSTTGSSGGSASSTAA